MPMSTRRIPALCAHLLCAALGTPSLASELVFREASAELGLGPAHRSGSLYGPGIATVDFDLDGDLDLYLIDDQLGNRLLRNDAGSLVDVAAAKGLALRPDGVTEPQHPAVMDIGGMMPCFVDLDNDGDRDFYLTVWQQPARLFRNDDGHFYELANSSHSLLGANATAAFGDYDRDGWLDVYVCNWGEPGRLLRNGRNLGFSDASSSSGIWDIPIPAQPGWSAQWYYFDADAAPELFVSVDYGFPNLLYWNLGNSFVERSATWFLPGQNAGASMGQAFGDFDHDGDDDLYIANTGGNDFYSRQSSGYVNLFATPDPRWTVLKEKQIGWFVDWIDLDNDGWLDLFLVLGYIPLCAPGVPDFPYGCDPPTVWRQRDRLWQNTGGTFVDVGATAGIADPDFGRGASRADFDLDGDIDLIVTNNNGPTRFYWNETEAVGDWLSIRLRGTIGNRDAYGARIFATAGGFTQQRTYASTAGYLSQPPDEVYVGFGDASSVDSLRVLWPNGLSETYLDVPTGRRIELREGARAQVGERLPAPPSLSAVSRREGVALSVQLAGTGSTRVRLHKAAANRWSGVIADFEVEGTQVEWIDSSAQAEEAVRYLVEAEQNGNWMMSDALEFRHQIPASIGQPALPAAVPNPFNPGTALSFDIPDPGLRHVRLAIYDLAGRLRRVLVDGRVASGKRDCRFDGRDGDGVELPSGTYLVRLSVEGFESIARKITLLR